MKVQFIIKKIQTTTLLLAISSLMCMGFAVFMIHSAPSIYEISSNEKYLQVDSLFKSLSHFSAKDMFQPENLFCLSMSPIRLIYEKGVIWRSEDAVWEETFYDPIYTIDNENEPKIENSEISEGTKPVISLTMYPPKSFNGIDGVYINNEDNKKYSLEELLVDKPDIKLKNTAKPQVLIIHTHATESYNELGLNYYDENNPFRSEDNNKNVIHIGDIAAQMLEKSGYTVVHDTTQHDNPNFTGSYTSSNKAIKAYLEKYPTIKVVLDIHRDTLITEKNIKYRPVVSIDGQQSAQVMLLMGGGNSTYQNSHWKENMKFAVSIQKIAAKKYPNLMRPILLRNSRYNQQLSNGSLLVEIGTCGNSMREAELAAIYFTDALIEVLDDLK